MYVSEENIFNDARLDFSKPTNFDPIHQPINPKKGKRHASAQDQEFKNDMSSDTSLLKKKRKRKMNVEELETYSSSKGEEYNSFTDNSSVLSENVDDVTHKKKKHKSKKHKYFVDNSLNALKEEEITMEENKLDISLKEGPDVFGSDLFGTSTPKRKKKRKIKTVTESAENIFNNNEIEISEGNVSEDSTCVKMKIKKHRSEELDHSVTTVVYLPGKKKKRRKDREESAMNSELSSLDNDSVILAHSRKEKKKKRKTNIIDTDFATLEETLHSKKKKKKHEQATTNISSKSRQFTSASSSEDIADNYLNTSKHKKRKKSERINDENVPENRELPKKKHKTKITEFSETVKNKSLSESSDLNDSDRELFSRKPSDENSSLTDRLRKGLTSENVDEVFVNIKESLQLSREQQEKLSQLYILIRWEVPAAHKIETRMSSVPTKEQRKMFEEQNVKLKLGPYSKAEDEILKANWREFCREHDLEDDPQPFLNFMHDKKQFLPYNQRVEFVRYLGKNLSDRMLYTIYRRFQLLFQFPKKGKFTPEEDEILLNAVLKYKKPFSVASQLLNRHRGYVIDRYNILIRKEGLIQWDLENCEKLLNAIKRATKVESVEELKNKEITATQWTKVAQLMKCGIKAVKRCWSCKLYPGLFSDDEDFRMEVVDKLCNVNVDDWRVLNWKEIAAGFEGLTGPIVAHRIRTMVGRYVPKELQDSIKESMKFIKDRKIEYKIHARSRKKFAVEDGHLVALT